MQSGRIAAAAGVGVAIAAALAVAPASAIDTNPCVAVFDDLDSTTLHTCTIALDPGIQQIAVVTEAFEPGAEYTLTVADHKGATVASYACAIRSTGTVCTVHASDPRVISSRGEGTTVLFTESTTFNLVADLFFGGTVILDPGRGLGVLTLSARSAPVTFSWPI